MKRAAPARTYINIEMLVLPYKNKNNTIATLNETFIKTNINGSNVFQILPLKNNNCPVNSTKNTRL
jgi:hypothetical protein